MGLEMYVCAYVERGNDIIAQLRRVAVARLSRKPSYFYATHHVITRDKIR